MLFARQESVEAGTTTRTAKPFRFIASAAAAALALGGVVAGVAAPANAAETGSVTGGSFTWKVSDRVGAHLTTRSFSNGASEDASTRAITWVNGSGTVNTETGATDISYEGDATLAFAAGGTTYYSVSLGSPRVVSTSEGGAIYATVSSFVAPQGSTPAVNTGPTENVKVASFPAGTFEADLSEATLTSLPGWAGVLPPGEGTLAQQLTGSATLPVDGASFDPDFLSAIAPGVRAHFYKSGASSDAAKPPVAFTANATLQTPGVVVDTVSTTPRDGVELSVSGDGFRAVTEPNDAGIYVALAPSGQSPADLPRDEGTAVTVAVQWLNSLDNGTFTTDLVAPTAKLDSAKDYSIYTWQAHTHSNTSQDTETPVVIDWEALEWQSSSTSVVVSSKGTYGKSVTAVALVSGGTSGNVAFYVDGKGAGVASVVDGKATKALSKTLALGSHEVTAKFLGDATHSASESSAKSLTVAQATASTVKISGKSFAKGSNPSVTITVGKLSNGSYYTGKVTLKNSAGKVVKTGTIKSSGKVTVKLSKQSKSLKLKATIGSTTVKSKSSTWTTIKVKS